MSLTGWPYDTPDWVLSNFAGYDPDQMLAGMIDLSLYTEEHLR